LILAYDRLVTKLTKENLWLYILRMLSERPMYAYEISKNLKNRFHFSVATVTTYVILYRMQFEGLIRVKTEKIDPRRADRKYYEPTEKGLETLQKGKSFLQEVITRLQ